MRRRHPSHRQTATLVQLLVSLPTRTISLSTSKGRMWVSNTGTLSLLPKRAPSSAGSLTWVVFGSGHRLCWRSMMALSRWSCTRLTQPTSLTGNTTSRLVDPGRQYRASRAARPCEYYRVRIAEPALTHDSVNWYQRNYPYVWAGARVVTDL